MRQELHVKLHSEGRVISPLYELVRAACRQLQGEPRDIVRGERDGRVVQQPHRVVKLARQDHLGRRVWVARGERQGRVLRPSEWSSQPNGERARGCPDHERWLIQPISAEFEPGPQAETEVPPTGAPGSLAAERPELPLFDASPPEVGERPQTNEVPEPVRGNVPFRGARRTVRNRPRGLVPAAV